MPNEKIAAVRYKMTELKFSSGLSEAECNRVQIDMKITGPDGKIQKIPGYYSGGDSFTVRYMPQLTGSYTYQVLWSGETSQAPSFCSGELESVPYTGENPLYLRGPIKVAGDRKHFEYADRTPFFWFGDTWWNGLCKRFLWPDDFMMLTADRAKKGFNVVQITAGMPPIMDCFDPRAANEAGYVWEKDYVRPNRFFFDLADNRIAHLVEQGIMPCILGSWGYQCMRMPIQKLREHWRYLIARWGAYPVVWCLAGEGSMPWYDDITNADTSKKQIDIWSGMARFLRDLDPYGHLISIHPCFENVTPYNSSRCEVTDDTLIDFDMQQNPHRINDCIAESVKNLRWSVEQQNTMPVLNDETCYENVFDASPPIMQRALLWTSILSGAVAGYNYGASGIWEFATDDEPDAGLCKPQNLDWGLYTWKESYDLPGSKQLGCSKSLLSEYEWWRIEPHQEWITPAWDGISCLGNFAGGIPGKLRFIYNYSSFLQKLVVHHLEPGVCYETFFFNPMNAERHQLGVVCGNENGDWNVPMPPKAHDWVLVMQARL